MGENGDITHEILSPEKKAQVVAEEVRKYSKEQEVFPGNLKMGKAWREKSVKDIEKIAQDKIKEFGVQGEEEQRKKAKYFVVFFTRVLDRVRESLYRINMRSGGGTRSFTEEDFTKDLSQLFFNDFCKHINVLQDKIYRGKRNIFRVMKTAASSVIYRSSEELERLIQDKDILGKWQGPDTFWVIGEALKTHPDDPVAYLNEIWENLEPGGLTKKKISTAIKKIDREKLMQKLEIH